MVEAPVPLDHVTVPTICGDIVMPWESRQALIKQFKHLALFSHIRLAFHAAGGSEPVQLTWGQKRDLVDLIHLWCRRTPGGFDGLPAGMHELWSALKAELHGTSNAVDVQQRRVPVGSRDRAPVRTPRAPVSTPHH